MLGNVFSPRWAKARERDPESCSLDFSTLNVALRVGHRNRWSLTERSRGAVARTERHLRIGASEMRWHGNELRVRVDERTAPWGTQLRGNVRLIPQSTSDQHIALDPKGLHTWSPKVPLAHVEVTFDAPRVAFRGVGYFDVNEGECPLEDTFSSWSWSRISNARESAIAYDVTTRDDGFSSRAYAATAGGGLTQREPGSLFEMSTTRFGLARVARHEYGQVVLRKTLENGPFYARSLVSARLPSGHAHGFHESVSLDRLRAPWVKFLVPFRTRTER
jgi:carotenoid 1,2-hydratase